MWGVKGSPCPAMGAGLSTGAIIAISFNGVAALLLLLLCTIVCRACRVHPVCAGAEKLPTPQQSQQSQESQQSQQSQQLQQSQPRNEGSHLLQP